MPACNKIIVTESNVQVALHVLPETVKDTRLMTLQPSPILQQIREGTARYLQYRIRFIVNGNSQHLTTKPNYGNTRKKKKSACYKFNFNRIFYSLLYYFVINVRVRCLYVYMFEKKKNNGGNQFKC